MIDTYQAVYDAVRSRIQGGDLSEAVRSAVSQEASGLSYAIESVRFEFAAAADAQRVAAHEAVRPSVLFRPSLSIDGDQWCALYGPDIQVGVAGFGDTPASAMTAFDAEWIRPAARGAQ
ncbi:hypothetical protein BBB39_13160 [Bordetella trematum]|uniref:Uncharacterized protein n=1 Tax=Bordetella trematum TaxID=123899 RepID=A0A157RKB8_9BORD|nr:hypothetical protein [Bordetella trematum]AZR94620.1 hypothetical protein BBB39_13160 [Bordetella trematum]NNH19104.1 hypothetical protein [Bordetella trematum]SAI58420.1 Uncharacterised protein [Bordetella trematum]SAI73937.1 Uncharacterised protein [Bordetella trematum]SUV97133.1 Uncharacterised protein [Bordetella trematum]